MQESFRLVLPIRNKAAALFYERLLVPDPSVRPMSAHTDGPRPMDGSPA